MWHYHHGGSSLLLHWFSTWHKQDSRTACYTNSDSRPGSSTGKSSRYPDSDSDPRSFTNSDTDRSTNANAQTAADAAIYPSDANATRMSGYQQQPLVL